jgi:tRNA 2-(methylsulfanyl)-N6-isopentenyladenosine37 hydroxylase
MFCLRVPTDPAWAREAASDLDGVLVDHAHCEMKAATNALSLVVRHPGEHALARALTELAQEELDHFARVLSFLEQRGLPLGSPPIDEYAAELRSEAARLPRTEMPVVVDRLLIGALIEARSCERFKLLLEALPADVPHDLRAFYRELFECEARHYRTYVDLAQKAGQLAGKSEEAVLGRLHAFADAEGRIVERLAERARRATVHG